MSARFRVAAYFIVLTACMWIPEIYPRDDSRFDAINDLRWLFANDTEKATRFGLGTPDFDDSAKEKEEEDRHVRLEDHRILCEVIKKRVEFRVSGMTHKPDSLMLYACGETKTNPSRYPMVQEMIDFESDRDDTEFCWISKERGPPRCETQHQQVAVFSREFGSSLWSYQNVHVPAGCGCHLGLKHFN